MGMSEAEKQEWRRSHGVRFEDPGGYEPVSYDFGDPPDFEDAKPLTWLEKWKKLLDNANEAFANPPGDCSPIDPIELPVYPHPFTKGHIEEVREKIDQMCPGFDLWDLGWYLQDWEGTDEEKDLLTKPIGRELLYEIETGLTWCGCGPTIIYEESLPRIYVCPPCGYPDFSEFSGTVGDHFGGMQVGPPGQIHRYWQYGHYGGPGPGGNIHTNWSGQASGPVSCEGYVENTVNWQGVDQYDVSYRVIGIPYRSQARACQGVGECYPIIDVYAEAWESQDPYQMQFRIINDVVSFVDCEES